jgi:RNA polymerase sigma-70 factor (ECF subfamily)
VQGVLRGQPSVTIDRGTDSERVIANLVAQAKHGDGEAFSNLYRLHVERVYDYAMRRLGERQAAEEVTQEIFFRAFRGVSGCRDEAAFAGWLFGIARFVIADTFRARGLRVESLDLAPDPEDRSLLPEEIVLQSERGEELRAARERCLSSTERELFDLLLADLTDREIAVALGRRAGAVRTAHWRLLMKLRTCFGIPATTKGNGGQHVAS